MPADANAVLQTSVTKTATFNGTGFDLKSATPRRGLWVRILYSAATNASGSNTVTFSVDESADNSTWYVKTQDNAEAVALSTTAQAAEIILPIETEKRYIRVTATFSGAGSTPTITYEAALVAGKP